MLTKMMMMKLVIGEESRDSLMIMIIASSCRTSSIGVALLSHLGLNLVII
jgi:hypothetical protein